LSLFIFKSKRFQEESSLLVFTFTGDPMFFVGGVTVTFFLSVVVDWQDMGRQLIVIGERTEKIG
jgi:hypothetical protein